MLQMEITIRRQLLAAGDYSHFNAWIKLEKEKENDNYTSKNSTKIRSSNDRYFSCGENSSVGMSRFIIQRGLVERSKFGRATETQRAGNAMPHSL